MMGRRRTETAQPQTNARRDRWELEQILKLLYVPATDHEPTIARLRGIGDEVRSETRRTGGSFGDQLEAVWTLLAHRPTHPGSDASLKEWAEGHIRTLDAHRKRSHGAPRKLDGGGTLAAEDYYPVNGDHRTADGTHWLVPDDELPPV